MVAKIELISWISEANEEEEGVKVRDLIEKRGDRAGRGEPMKYTVIYEHGPTSWGAYVPDLPGVITVADSREEAERFIAEAVEFHLDGMREEGIPIPTPSSFAGMIEVSP
jgi:predicted RNase H-like HicB family nuclease